MDVKSEHAIEVHAVLVYGASEENVSHTGTINTLMFFSFSTGNSVNGSNLSAITVIFCKSSFTDQTSLFKD